MPSDFDQMYRLCTRFHAIGKNYNDGIENIEINYQNNKKHLNNKYNRKKDEIGRLQSKIRQIADDYSNISGFSISYNPYNPNKQLIDSTEDYIQRLEDDLEIEKNIKKPISFSIIDIGYIMLQAFFGIFLLLIIHIIAIIVGHPIGGTSIQNEISVISLFLVVVIYNLKKRKVRTDIIILVLLIVTVVTLLIEYIPELLKLPISNEILDNHKYISIISILISYFCLPVWFGIFLQNKFIHDEVKQNKSNFTTNYENAYSKLINELQSITTQYQQQYQTLKTKYIQENDKSESLAIQQYNKIISEIENYNKNVDLSGKNWAEPEWRLWHPSQTIPMVITLGQLIPKDLKNTQNPDLSINALHPFAKDGKNIIFISDDEAGRRKIYQAIQAMCLRLFATTPPGMCTFYFIDPNMMGGNLHGFSRLPDDRKYLIHDHALTDPSDISRCLDEVLNQINRIYETKLQNTYNSIDEYNSVYPRLKEPYKIISIFDIPLDRYREIIPKIITISNNGPKCGIYLIIHSTKEQFKEFALIKDQWSIITQQSNYFSYFFSPDTWDTLYNYDLILDNPPDNNLFNHVIKVVSESIEPEKTITFDELIQGI